MYIVRVRNDGNRKCFVRKNTSCLVKVRDNRLCLVGVSVLGKKFRFKNLGVRGGRCRSDGSGCRKERKRGLMADAAEKKSREERAVERIGINGRERGREVGEKRGGEASHSKHTNLLF